MKEITIKVDNSIVEKIYNEVKNETEKVKKVKTIEGNDKNNIIYPEKLRFIMTKV